MRAVFPSDVHVDDVGDDARRGRIYLPVSELRQFDVKAHELLKRESPWGYSDRFLAVSRQGLDAALERLPPSLDEAATGLGCGWWAVLRRVHLPLLRGPLLVGALLVFVDVVKELPLSFALRPFDFDTLSVRVYQYASDERLGAALIPAGLILALGVVASLALVPGLERRSREPSPKVVGRELSAAELEPRNGALGRQGS
jgi:ABC-type uncharacterized transport system YnjBCD permease subunit